MGLKGRNRIRDHMPTALARALSHSGSASQTQFALHRNIRRQTVNQIILTSECPYKMNGETWHLESPQAMPNARTHTILPVCESLETLSLAHKCCLLSLGRRAIE